MRARPYTVKATRTRLGISAAVEAASMTMDKPRRPVSHKPNRGSDEASGLRHAVLSWVNLEFTLNCSASGMWSSARIGWIVQVSPSFTLVEDCSKAQTLRLQISDPVNVMSSPDNGCPIFAIPAFLGSFTLHIIALYYVTYFHAVLMTC